LQHAHQRIVTEHRATLPSPAVAIRDAVPSDLVTIAALIRALADYEQLADEVVFDEQELGRWLFAPHPSVHVLLATEGDDEVMGMALYHLTFSTFLGRPGIWLEDLFVRPEARGRGHGRMLLEALMQRTPGRLEWAVLDWNTSAIDFYQGLGARPVEGWTRYRWVAPGT
jgi:GNAT superfamily N-acetyltransferase